MRRFRNCIFCSYRWKAVLRKSFLVVNRAKKNQWNFPSPTSSVFLVHSDLQVNEDYFDLSGWYWGRLALFRRWVIDMHTLHVRLEYIKICLKDSLFYSLRFSVWGKMLKIQGHGSHGDPSWIHFPFVTHIIYLKKVVMGRGVHHAPLLTCGISMLTEHLNGAVVPLPQFINDSMEVGREFSS